MTNKRTLYYNPHLGFPNSSWAIKFDVPILRTDIPYFCEQLHSIVSQRHGAAFYYPNVDVDTVTCRYEWPQVWKRKKFSLHLGLIFKVGRDDLAEVVGYVTTNDALENNSLELPKFGKRFVDKLQSEFVEILNYAEQLSKPESRVSRHIIFHVELHPQVGYKNVVQTEDNTIRIFPSTLIEGKLVSAICVNVHASTNEGAKPSAFRSATLLCALLTLAKGLLCETTNMEWGNRKAPIQYLSSLDEIDFKTLYPRFIEDVPTVFDEKLPEITNYIWRLFTLLSQEEQEEFLPALFAYYSGISLNKSKYGTLAIVAHIAALSSLAESKKQKCLGQLNCSEHWTLSWKHDLIGDKAAILTLINELLKSKPEDQKKLDKLIDRTYHKQRSAYVHAAELRHEEFQQGYGLPSSFPGSESIVRDLFFFKQDLHSVEQLVRYTLLHWLTAKLSVELDKNLLGLKENIPFVELPMEAMISLPKGIVVVPFHDGQATEN